MNKAVGILDKVGIFSRWTNVVGLAALFLMVALTFIDVFARYVFNRPIKGASELTEVIMICAIFLAVAYTQNTKSHIAIDIITSRLSPKPRTALEFIATLLATGIFVIISWKTLTYAIFLFAEHRAHDKILLIPGGPFGVAIFVGCASMTLLLIRDLLHTIIEANKFGFTWRQWLIMLGIPALFVVFAWAWLQPGLWNISLTLTGLIGIILSLVLFFSGMPISISLLLTSFLFIGHLRNVTAALDTLPIELYRNSGNYNWSVLPFFVLMGYFCLYGGFGEDLYQACHRWFGHLRGGLSVATIGAGTAFAAIVGDPLSSVVTIGSASLPQMRKYKYDDVLTAGCIIGGATLGPIIPPSTAFVIYGLLTGVSIGDLLISGIFPGLLMSACFIAIIYFWCRINPDAGPRGERSGWRARIVSLKAGGPVLVLFLLVIGGIYIGIFTPTEGGSIGAVVAFLLGLAMRRYTWRKIGQTLVEGGKLISMVFLILIGAVMFTRFLAWCNISQAATNLINGLGLGPMGYMLFVIVILTILGCFIDIMPLMLIGIPIMYPISVNLGIHPILFGVIFVITTNLGAITPPVGVVLFALKGVAKDIPISTIYKGAIPFSIGTLVALALLLVFPSIATWLPAALRPGG